jgi:hypothetical protein
VTPVAHRRLVAAEALLLLGPATIVTWVLFAVALLFSLRGTPANLFVAGNGVLAVYALSATWVAVAGFRARGEEALVEMRPWMIFFMGVGLALIALGALALVVESIAAPIDTGALAFNLIGLPAVVPCVHLLWLRKRALSTVAEGRRAWIALVGLAVVLAALQWIATGPLPFDRESWDAHANDTADPWFRRQRMADWLMLDGSLVGHSRAEVMSLLGKPDNDSEHGLSYVLGDARGLEGFGNDLLSLPVDARGRVTGAEIWNND